MTQHNDHQRQYPVLRRPPRDFFTPIAEPIAGLLYVVSFIAILCFIGFAAHNLAAREPTLVEPPQGSTYARDYRQSAIADLTETKPQYLSVPVRLRDRENLRKHIHQHITAHGGILVIGHLHAEDPPPKKEATDRDIPRNHHIYHVNGEYLETLQGLDRPPWQNPTYYAQWAREQDGQEPAKMPLPDTYVKVSTQYLWFENTHVRFLTIIIAASITAALLTAIALSVGMAICQERSRPDYHR